MIQKRDDLIILRNKKNWSQKDVTDLLNIRFSVSITESYYGMIEQGSRIPSLNVAMAIAKLFKVSPDSLFNKKSKS
ncbi:helix-turn-helix transcriptional regulator [Shouchella lehensis]|uniref:XRE family transcriptional regulator n=1 Tax=Shouchella lehensis TaxID=300825 RepID=A0A4Y7WKF9_9BACI|nr:helix-turn-helix transcriptional regulator [Shouchella lehensis]MBG9783471.1 hypothetical protein [Shouchella lehensis]TES49136.1 XRE family transcriptional regulator [Shouchella lehensis]